jgi:putative heme-binding domain-containing protein
MSQVNHESIMRLLISVLALYLTTALAEQPPVVHMLVPGFTVQELPVHLSNINNLRFAPDGRLFALGYDGRIHVLRDTNGDGLEDSDQLFWDKPGISVPVGMALTPEGVYVSSHGKVSLLRDIDGDGKADKEEIIASGWPPTDVASGGVDATALTLDKNGDIYFGLITADYSNPYRIKDGVSHYELNGKRGTIQRLSRDHNKMETVANGIRVPFALAFNKAGDLFCTDQEGETWCPNGNPLDELNHIIPGRNYGFPPPHEKWLPNLQSENPVVGFGPQHQSTCGLVFNEPRKGQGLFGPKWWEGDAFIAGESRGKIWRVRLAKTPHGYVGKEFLIARLSMLTIDLAISPRGDLYVCCHSGQPDWGTGPNGEGKIFKISYTDPKAPQPVIAWASGPMETRIAFDKPVDPSVTNGMLGSVIEFGDYVRAADRLEVLKPPYKVVAQQEATPRGKLKIVGAKLANRQTLALTTDPHPLATTYALTVRNVKAAGVPGIGDTVDLDYDLSGFLNPTDWLSLVRTLPNGREIANVEKSGQWSVPGSKPPNYPYIHPAVSESDKNIALVGGDYERGRALFFGDKLKCSTCHRIRDEGKTIGPDLSNLPSKDAASVLKDIKEPNASINPDYVAYNVALQNGESLTGFVRAQDEQTLRLVAADGKETVLHRAEVKALTPSSTSLMPTGLLDALNESQIKDLLTFLLNAPPTRTRDELTKALNPISASPSVNRIKIILVASKQDHGPAQHDYPAWQKNWHALLARSTSVIVEDAWLWPAPEQFEHADVLVFYYWNRDWNAEKMGQLDEFLARGKGIVVLHSATIGNPMVDQLAERIGLASDSVKTKYLHTPIDLTIVATNNPIMHGLPKQMHFIDEPYWPMIGDTNRIEVLATAAVDGADWPIMWTFQKEKGRVFASIFGHYTWTWEDPIYQIIVLRGIAWTAGEDPATLESLATSEFEIKSNARKN